MSDKTYKVYMTPLVSENTYGDEIEISNYVSNANLGNIKKSTDSGDNAIGEYVLGSVNLTCANFCGEFNENDSRSLFPYKRENAKIRVDYYSDLTTYTGSFKGIVDDQGTVVGDDDQIKLKVLALESILRKVQLASGGIQAGDLFSEAIKSIINRTAITSVLTYDSSKIEVDLDLTVDTAGSFTGLSTWDALKLLLIASNSVVFINDETIEVRARDYDTGEIEYFYGPGDTLDRENIISITAYNNGAHRIFNSIKINDYIDTDDTSAEWFGLKQKAFTLDFITDSTKELQIARNLVQQFRYPRIEFKMTVTTDLANEVGFFDTVGVAHPIRSKPCCGYHASLWDVAEYDTVTDVWNIEFGGIAIDGTMAFKMIERTENVKDFTTTIKMRNRGKTFDDGVLIYWQAIWDQSIYDTSTW